MKKCSLCFLVDLNKTKLCPQKYIPFREKLFISLSSCLCNAQEHFKKWKSCLDPRLVHLAAGTVKVSGYSVFVYVSPHHFMWHDENMPLKTNLFHWNASSRGAGSCDAQEQCWYITNCKYFPSTIILSFRYVHRETSFTLEKPLAFCWLVL